MPIREYIASDVKKSCDHCRGGFERIEATEATPHESCPRCGAAIERQFSTSNVGGSQSGLDQRAKSAGFTKFGKLGSGEYEKKF
jgi:predicted nucleic acid-binding Zn ribbon protein